MTSIQYSTVYQYTVQTVYGGPVYSTVDSTAMGHGHGPWAMGHGPWLWAIQYRMCTVDQGIYIQ